MRDTYYQSVDNPLQLDRLPTTRPEMEMLPPAVATTVTLSEVAAIFLTAAAAAITALVMYRCPGLPWLEPYDLIFASPTVVVGLGVCFITRHVRWFLHPLLLVAILLIFVNHRMPWGLQVVVISGTMGLLVYVFGRHWSTVCTANPTPRATAELFRTQSQQQLFVLAGIASVLTGAVLWTDAAVLKLAVVTLPLAALAVRRPAGLRSARWRVVFDSLTSWIMYHARPLPGLLQSPVGPAGHRRGLMIFATVLTTVVLLRWPDSPLPRLIDMAWKQHQSVTQQLDARRAGIFERLRYGGLTWGLAFIAIVSLPVLLPWALTIPLTMPVLLEAAAERDRAKSSNSIEVMLTDLRRSPDLTERHSIYMGRVVADGSPVLVPRDVFREHAHGLGDAGAGKTSLFLCPLIEQLVMARTGKDRQVPLEANLVVIRELVLRKCRRKGS